MKLSTVLALLVACLPAQAQHSVSLTWGATGCVPNNGGYINCNGNTQLCDHLTGYRIYRAPPSGGMAGLYSLIGSTTGSLSFTDSTVNANEVWWYAVTGVLTPLCETGYSNQVQVQVPPSVGDLMIYNGTHWIAKTPNRPIRVKGGPKTTPSVGDVLRWGGTSWAAYTPASPIRGITPLVPLAGDVLLWNGSAWAPKTPSTPIIVTRSRP